MSNKFIQFAAPGIANLQPYVPGKPVSELERELGISNSVKLASNENPLGPSPKVREALTGEIAELSRYPDGASFALKRALAEKHGVGDAQVTLGNGSNDVLDMIARVFLGQGKESLFSQHAFAVYPISTLAVGAKPVVSPAKDYGHDLQAMRTLISDNTGVIWIANPNNPTGTWLAQDELKAFIADVPKHVIVVLDEAYFEYVEETAYPDGSEWLAEFDNLVVCRTFSKAYGLASLRVGYALSHPDVADLLNRVRQPFNVNSFAQAAALAALQDRDHLQQGIAVNKQGMKQLTEGLAEQGLGYIPSVGNFVTVDFARDAAPINQTLLEKGVIVRPVGGYELPNHLRVSIGLPEENQRFLDALKAIL